MKRGGPGGYCHGMQASRLVICAVAAAAVGLGACAVAPGPGGDEVGVVTAAQLGTPGEDDPCPPNGCGGNSPVVAGVYFWRLHVGGLPNPEGVAITGAKNIGGSPMQLAAAPEGDRLIGVSLDGLSTVTQGTSLIGTRISLLVGGQSYEIIIDWVEPTEKFWVVDGTKSIESYTFLYRPLGSAVRPIPLCSDEDGNPALLRALVFTGDLYNPATKHITVGPETDGWLNIACAGSATYKMHKIGYTTAAQGRLGLMTTIAQRRAMLNAWTSNVCGTGRSFTKQGEPITLREVKAAQLPTSPYLAAAVTREAIWSEAGAVCLDVHRRVEDEPDIYDQIKAECGASPVPACTPAQWGSWQAYGAVITGNPTE